ncbi:hypothetical protein [Roseomonas populi]|uniref:Uncharacterized protein n=1 Tax=Roseomonas populi TaxID=3121582 RepID=A0ABT1X151_9PROT|nr:hypothetical protein [Roseomonas pecuniae]MCR0981823.1 hypothetical protein [Roseomonas pecuniae]
MRGNARPPVPRPPAPVRHPDVPQVVRWDGLVPAEHRGAFAHKITSQFGRPMAARWCPDMIAAAGGYWWVEGQQGGLSPSQVSANGWAYGGPLLDQAHRDLDARVERAAHRLFSAVQAFRGLPMLKGLIRLRRAPEFAALADTWADLKLAKDARAIAGHSPVTEIETSAAGAGEEGAAPCA